MAIVAATIAIFYPHLLHSTFNLDTGNVYLLLISLSIITFWKGLTADSVKNFFLTGILLGLSYLTRPEAFGYLFFFIPWLGLSKFFSGQKVFSRNLPKNAAILLFGFALMATPYIFYLRSATDTWTISGKFKRHVIGDENFLEKKRAYDKALEAPNYISETGKIFLKITFFNLHSIHKKVPYIFPPFLLIFVGIGLFRTNWTGSRFKREIYLFSFCATTVLGYALSVNNVVYFYVLLPILIGWVARGIVEMAVWWRESFQIFPINQRFISNLPIFFNFVYYPHKYLRPSAEYFYAFNRRGVEV